MTTWEIIMKSMIQVYGSAKSKVTKGVMIIQENNQVKGREAKDERYIKFRKGYGWNLY
jgi:hypothetical protein